MVRSDLESSIFPLSYLGIRTPECPLGCEHSRTFSFVRGTDGGPSGSPTVFVQVRHHGVDSTTSVYQYLHSYRLQS